MGNGIHVALLQEGTCNLLRAVNKQASPKPEAVRVAK